LERRYPDRASYDACRARLAKPDAAAGIAADEERLFDRPRNRFYILDERDSDLPQLRPD